MNKVPQHRRYFMSEFELYDTDTSLPSTLSALILKDEKLPSIFQIKAN